MSIIHYYNGGARTYDARAVDSLCPFGVGVLSARISGYLEKYNRYVKLCRRARMWATYTNNIKQKNRLLEALT